MVLKEVQHVWLDVAEELPVAGDAGCRLPKLDRHAVIVDILLHDGAQSVVQAGFVIKVVKSYIADLLPVKILLVYFSDENHLRVLCLDLTDQPCHEFRRNKLDHIAAESVHAF